MNSAGPRAIALRPMVESDVAAGVRLSTSAGWNQTEGDWALFLRLSPGACFVATDQERVVGTVTTLRYVRRLAWISMLLVDPTFRGRGIGSALFERALRVVSGWGTIALDATPLGRALYARQGFVTRHGIDRLVTDQVPAVGGDLAAGVEPVGAEDWPAIATLDGPVFGADRTPVLWDLWRRAPEMSWLRKRGGRLVGVCLGRHGTRHEQLGPVVAERLEDAVALCRACLRWLQGRPAVIDVPSYQGAMHAWLAGFGFSVQRSLERMVLARGDHGPQLDVNEERQYAIGGPELG